jgi:hypothetical protein
MLIENCKLKIKKIKFKDPRIQGGKQTGMEGVTGARNRGSRFHGTGVSLRAQGKRDQD